jgi:hypothetical protein
MAKMAEIVHKENRPFSSGDFLLFNYNGRTYKFKPGTIRNYFSKLAKRDQISFVYRSTSAYYTLSGVKTRKMITPYHTGVNFSNQQHPISSKQDRFIQFLLRIPMDKDSIHDIRLWFKVKGLWEVIQMYSDYGYPVKSIDLKSNRNVVLEDLDYGDHIIKTTVHKTDGISVIVACTSTPIPVDMIGLIKLSASLARVEEKLQRIVGEYLRQNIKGYKRSSSLITKGPIPDYKTWIVNMWHFGQDSLTCYTGEMFEISWGEAVGMFHVYSKDDLHDKKKEVRVRKEVQEHPNKPWFDVFVERVKFIDKNGPGFFNERFNEYFGGEYSFQLTKFQFTLDNEGGYRFDI